MAEGIVGNGVNQLVFGICSGETNLGSTEVLVYLGSCNKHTTARLVVDRVLISVAYINNHVPAQPSLLAQPTHANAIAILTG